MACVPNIDFDGVAFVDVVVPIEEKGVLPPPNDWAWDDVLSFPGVAAAPDVPNRVFAWFVSELPKAEVDCVELAFGVPKPPNVVFGWFALEPKGEAGCCWLAVEAPKAEVDCCWFAIEELRSGYERSFPDDALSFPGAGAADDPNIVLDGVALEEAPPRNEKPPPPFPPEEEAAVVEALNFGAACWVGPLPGKEPVLLDRTLLKTLAVFDVGLDSAARCFLDGVSVFCCSTGAGASVAFRLVDRADSRPVTPMAAARSFLIASILLDSRFERSKCHADNCVQSAAVGALLIFILNASFNSTTSVAQRHISACH